MSRMLDLLYVYDATVSQLEGRQDADYTIALNGGGVKLAEELVSLVKRGMMFRRAVITCHGDAGVIRLDGNDLDAKKLSLYFKNAGLERLLPLPGSRIYFNGCAVGKEPGGREFLLAAAQVFFRLGGGTAFGMTSLGVFVDCFLGTVFPPLGIVSIGHVVHLGGRIVSVTVAPGGAVVPDPPIVWPDPPRGRDNLGTKI